MIKLIQLVNKVEMGLVVLGAVTIFLSVFQEESK